MARILHYWLPVVAWVALITLFSTDAFHEGATEGILRSVLAFFLPSSSFHGNQVSAAEGRRPETHRRVRPANRRGKQFAAIVKTILKSGRWPSPISSSALAILRWMRFRWTWTRRARQQQLGAQLFASRWLVEVPDVDHDFPAPVGLLLPHMKILPLPCDRVAFRVVHGQL